MHQNKHDNNIGNSGVHGLGEGECYLTTMGQFKQVLKKEESFQKKISKTKLLKNVKKNCWKKKYRKAKKKKKDQGEVHSKHPINCESLIQSPSINHIQLKLLTQCIAWYQ